MIGDHEQEEKRVYLENHYLILSGYYSYIINQLYEAHLLGYSYVEPAPNKGENFYVAYKIEGEK